MGRHFGGRYGSMVLPTAAAADTQAVLSMQDHYYMKQSGGLYVPIDNITDLNSTVSWSYLPNVDTYSGNSHQGTYYNGSRFRITSNIGLLEFNNYEYPCFGKFDIRDGDVNNDVFFQLYAFQNVPMDFNVSTTAGNMFQMGVYWESSPNTDNLTNTLEATNGVANGDAAYFVNAGTGNKTWGWYTGGSGNNSEAQGSTNRETQTTVDWSGESITFVVYGQNAGANSSKIKVYKASTLIHTFTTVTVTAGRPMYIYLGAGYPNGLATKYTDGQPKFRYGKLAAGNTAL